MSTGIISCNEPADRNSLHSLLVPSSVERDWDWVAPLLEEIHSICDPDWEVEHVFTALTNEEAHIWTSWDGGFAITQPLIEPFKLDPYLLIWICHVGDHPYSEEDFGLITQFGRDNGCKWVELWSPRAGMPRHMEGHGFKVTNTVMRRQL